MFYEAFEEEEKAIKSLLPENIRARFTWKTIQEEGDSRPPAGLISIRTQSAIPDEWAGFLNAILTRSQGYDHLLHVREDACGGIDCGYLGNYCARGVAEQAVLMMMALLRKLKEQVKNMDDFARNGLTGLECRGRKVLIVGVGNIGGELVDIAKGLRMPVKGVDIAPVLEECEYVSLEEGIAWAQVVFCAVPLTRDTKGCSTMISLRKVIPDRSLLMSPAQRSRLLRI